MMTKNAVGNLINKYSAVLKKCAWLNACVLAGAVMCGSVGNVWGAEEVKTWEDYITIDLYSYDESTKTLKPQGDIFVNSKLFIVDSKKGTLTLENLVVDGFGCCIIYSDLWSNGTIETIKDVTLINNNTSWSTTSAIHASITNVGEIKSIEQSTFKTNTGRDYGGVVCNTGTIGNISSSIFGGNVISDKNAALCGGAIANGTGTYFAEYKITIIENTSFIHNAATSIYYEGGGAVYNYGVIETIKNSNFVSNTASMCGGAIDNHGTIGMIEEGYFTSNTALLGGAINNYNTINTIEGVTFGGIEQGNSNSAAFGGAILNWDTIGVDSDSGIVACKFIANKSTLGGGGAIYAAQKTQTFVTNSSFIDNKATVDNDIAQGGAIYLESAGTYSANGIDYYTNGAILHYTATEGSSINISGNSADEGGFLYLGGGTGYAGLLDYLNNPVYDAQATFDIQGADTTLTVGAWDNSTDDSIYAESGSVFTKTGAGTMLVRSTYTNGGSLLVNQGTMIIEGDLKGKEKDSLWYAKAMEQVPTGSTALMLGTSLKVGDGVAVGANVQNITNSATFGADSALVVHVDGTDAQGAGAALIGNGTDSVLTVESGAKLIVCGGNADDDIRIAKGFVAEEVEAPAPVITRAMAATPAAAKSSIDGWTLETDVTHVNPLFTIDESYWDGTDFFLSLGVNQEALGDLAQLASIAGVASNTASIATSAMDASGARFAFANFEPELERSFNLWATPLFSSVYSDGFDSSRDGKGGRSGYDTTFGGMNIGADYTTDKGYRLGLGLHAGYGETESHGEYEHTDNDFSFWGVTLYGGRTWDDFSVYADVNMSMTKSDLVQDNPAFAAAPLTAETDAYALTAEVRADYRISTEYMEILPHVGARFMNVNIDDYDVKQLGDTICSVESKDQNIWSFPVGVELSKTFDLGAPSQADQRNWTLTPRVDLGVIFAAGDIDADSTAFMPDRSVSQNMTMQTFDRFAYTVNLGVDMEYGNSTFGLEYGTRLSAHQTVQDVTATWRYAF